MTSLKTGCLLFLAAFLFLSIVPTVAEVVRSVADCEGYLLQENPPQLPGILESGNIQDRNRYKPICQTYNDRRRFLTLYDITYKIPVFSALKYTGLAETGAVGNDWKIEPQLEDENEPNKNMKEEERGKTYNNQATIANHNNGDNYNKGHLNPSTYGSTTEDKESTYTLTNIVPQEKDFNQGRWRNMEDCVKCVMDHFCTDNNKKVQGFLVTGAQPGTQYLNNRVNIPSIVWSAFCCYHSKRKMWIASAHWDNNVGEGPEYLQSQTLTDLHNTLGVGANLFPGTQCPLNQNLGDYRGLKTTLKHALSADSHFCSSHFNIWPTYIYV